MYVDTHTCLNKIVDICVLTVLQFRVGRELYTTDNAPSLLWRRACEHTISDNFDTFDHICGH